MGVKVFSKCRSPVGRSLGRFSGQEAGEWEQPGDWECRGWKKGWEFRVSTQSSWL